MFGDLWDPTDQQLKTENPHPLMQFLFARL